MTFTPNKPAATTEPRVVVDAGLPAGRHRFQLIVENDRGQRSAPAEVIVIIENRGRLEPVVPVRPGTPVNPTRPVRPPEPVGPVVSPVTPVTRTATPTTRSRRQPPTT